MTTTPQTQRPTLEEVRAAKDAINEFMAHWNDGLEPKHQSKVHHGRKVDSLRWISADVHHASNALYLASFQCDAEHDPILPIFFYILPDGHASLVTGFTYWQTDLYPENKGDEHGC